MTLNPLDELDRVRFAWPEPLVIELLGDHYGDLLPAGRRSAVVKMHQELLRRLIQEGDTDPARLRASFLAECRACGLSAEVVAEVDHAVFYELMRIVGIRFRNSPRLRELYGQRLAAALAAPPAAAPGPVARPAPARVPRRPVPPLRLRAAAAM